MSKKANTNVESKNEIYTIGQKVLRKPTYKVSKVTPKVKEIVEKMWRILNKVKGAGLSAPQIGVSKKIIVVDTGRMGECNTFINPEIIWKSDTYAQQREGCMSVVGALCYIWRPDKIRVKYMDLDGKDNELEAEGVYAAAIQHEIDHLNKILPIDYDFAEHRKIILDYYKVDEKSVEYELLKNEALGPKPEDRKEKPMIYDISGQAQAKNKATLYNASGQKL